MFLYWCYGDTYVQSVYFVRYSPVWVWADVTQVSRRVYKNDERKRKTAVKPTRCTWKQNAEFNSR